MATIDEVATIDEMATKDKATKDGMARGAGPQYQPEPPTLALSR